MARLSRHPGAGLPRIAQAQSGLRNTGVLDCGLAGKSAKPTSHRAVMMLKGRS